MTFGQALEHAKQGEKIARKGWNGKNMWVAMKRGKPLKLSELDSGGAEVLPYLWMKTADSKIVVGWLASQTDMLADDWFIFNAPMYKKTSTSDSSKVDDTPTRTIGILVNVPVDTDDEQMEIGVLKDTIKALKKDGHEWERAYDQADERLVELKAELKDTRLRLNRENDELREAVEEERAKSESLMKAAGQRISELREENDKLKDKLIKAVYPYECKANKC